MKKFFLRLQALVGAGEIPTLDNGRDYGIDAKYMALLVGVAAFSLPIGLRLSAEAGPAMCAYDSISPYYFSPWMGPVFVGSLFFIGAFLLGYRGLSRGENIAAGLAGVSAMGVALFPTSGDGCDDPMHRSRAFVDYSIDEAVGPETLIRNENWTLLRSLGEFLGFEITTSTLHFAFAGVVFFILMIFCLFFFTRIVSDQHRVNGTLTRAKRLRNAVYLSCGGVMAAMMALIVLHALGYVGHETVVINGEPVLTDLWPARNYTFWVEAAMLWCFGLSWALKGRLGWLGDLLLGDLLLDPADKADKAARGGTARP